MAFFSSLAGQYVLQALVHSTLLAFAVETFLRVSNVERAATRIQFRAIYLVLPVIGWPIYQLAWPSRGSAQFRSTLALFDTRQWLTLSLFSIPVWAWVSGLLALGALLFLSVIFLPAARRLIASGRKATTAAEAASGGNPGEKLPPVNDTRLNCYVVEDSRPMAYLDGIWNVRLMMTTGLAQILDEEELQAVIAHEEAHALRRDNLTSWWLLLTGLFMFFSPVAVIAIQRIGRDAELACDGDAVDKTKRPLALASAIIKTARHTLRADWNSRGFKVTGWLSQIDARSRKTLVVRRVKALTSYRASEDIPLKWAKLALTGVMSGTLMFFVV